MASTAMKFSSDEIMDTIGEWALDAVASTSPVVEATGISFLVGEAESGIRVGVHLAGDGSYDLEIHRMVPRMLRDTCIGFDRERLKRVRQVSGERLGSRLVTSVDEVTA